MVEGGGRAGELHTNTVGWQKRILVGYASHGRRRPREGAALLAALVALLHEMSVSW